MKKATKSTAKSTAKKAVKVEKVEKVEKAVKVEKAPTRYDVLGEKLKVLRDERAAAKAKFKETLDKAYAEYRDYLKSYKVRKAEAVAEFKAAKVTKPKVEKVEKAKTAPKVVKAKTAPKVVKAPKKPAEKAPVVKVAETKSEAIVEA